MENFCGSPLWDTNLTWNTPNPRFTPCFEKTILIWVPCSFLWFFSLFEIIYIRNSKEINIPRNWLYNSKLISIILLTLLTITDLSITIYYSFQHDILNVEYYTPLIKIATFLLSMIILICSRKYSLEVSGLLFLFWFLLMVCAVPQFRSQIMDRIDPSINDGDIYFFMSGIMYFMFLIEIFILNCFAEPFSSQLNYENQRKPSPENRASFIQKILFSWLDSLLLLGFKRSLVENDLWSLNDETKTVEVFKKFNKYWQKSSLNLKIKKLNPQKNADYDSSENSELLRNISILPSLIKAFGPEFFFGSLFRLIEIGVVFGSPLILGALITFVDSDDYVWKGYLFAFGLFFIGVFKSLVLSQHYYRMKIVGLKIRNALTSAIYRKSLRLSNLSRKLFTTGEIVNLMSVDADRFIHLFQHINVIWTGPIITGIAFYFLWQILGPSSMVGLAVIILLLPLNIIATRKVEKLLTNQMIHKDKRVKMISEILNGMKVLKLYAWESSFESLVAKLRNEELIPIKKYLYLDAFICLLWVFTPFLVSIITFTFFVLSDSNNVLDSKTAFVSISLFNIIQFPLSLIPHTILMVTKTSVALKRINKFMNAEELGQSDVGNNLSKENPLIIENGTFSWEKNEPILTEINISIPSGSLVAIVGHIGAGKSSLISAFLGEMNKISGTVNTLGSISYVSQQAWIQNCSLQNNILFGKPLKMNFYQSIINACALKPDLEILPFGDQTEIGEKGINLSGGQKQRVSFARAIYCDSDLYFFDDPLSAVDSHVGKHIFDQVIGPRGLLKEKTRILVTHSIGYLSQFDHIIVMKNGKISECGTYQQLLSNKCAFADFLLQHLMNHKQDESDVHEIKLQLEQCLGSRTFTEKLQRVQSLSESEIDVDHVKDNEMELSKQQTGHQLIETERIETGNIKWKIYYYYFMSFSIIIGVGTFVINSVFQGFTIGSNVWLTIWSGDETLNNNSTNNTQMLYTYLGVYGALGIGLVFSTYLVQFIPYLGSLAAAKIMHEALLDSILKSSMTFFDTTPIGRILSRFSKDVDTLNSSLPPNVSDFVYCLFQVLGTLLVISVAIPLFIYIVIPILLLYYFIQRYYIASARQLKRLESIARSPIYSHFGETLSGTSTIRAYRVQERFIKESENKVDDHQICFYPNMTSNRWLSVRLEFIANMIILFAALFAVIAKESLSPGLVGLSVTYSLEITENLNRLLLLSAQLENDMVSVERIKEYIENNREAPWEIPSTAPQSDWPTNGHIKIENLVMHYPSNTEPVLHNITCEIKSGEKVGIVGRTGAGKSTLTLALFRIHEASEGKIMIDGIDIATLGLHSLRSRLTIIPQDPILFSGSLRMNLDPFDIFSDIEVWNAIKRAHLHEFVEGLPAGLNHEISEGGENISVGQRQLVCLARALLRKTRVLILDEATAAVDLDTDNLIQNTIHKEFSSCTILTIAHRLNTIMDSNRILVLDKGKIAEFDSPEYLLSNKNSIFYNMAKDARLVD